MKLGAFAAGATWAGYWQRMRAYHRFEIAAGGLEHILGCAGPALIVGYHGKPGARDLIMLQTLLLHEYGERTHAVASDLAFGLPLLRQLAEGMQLVSRAPESIAAVVRRGEKLVVTPGGLAEAWASFSNRYRVRWKGLGYLRLAIRYRLPIIPVASVGVDEAFYSVFDAYRLWQPLWERLRPICRVPEGAGLWLGIGPLGVWPLTPPFPVAIVQYIDPPIYLDDHGLDDVEDREHLMAFHRHLVNRIQTMLDDGRDRARARSLEGKELTWVDQVQS